MKVGYQGNHGTFSEIAALRYFEGQNIEQAGYKSFPELFKDCQNGVLDCALIPVENTTTGIISRTYDLFQEYRIHAVGEIITPIREDLIALPGTRLEEIHEVYTHPEVISQCSRFFLEHPAITPIACQDTADGVRYVKQCGVHSKAALASSRASSYYEMESILKEVQDSDVNMTRFLCVSSHMKTDADANKISMMLVLKHEPGSLYKVLQVLADNKVNLLKLESRPIQGKVFEYCFYIDFTGNTEDEKMQKILTKMHESCVSDLLIGCYKAADRNAG